MKKTDESNETLRKPEQSNEKSCQEVDEVTDKGMDTGATGRSDMNETAEDPSEKLSNMHVSDENTGSESKPVSAKVKETLVGAKDRVFGAIDLESKEGGGKSWGQWASDGIKYAKDKVAGGSSVSKDEKGFSGNVKNHVTEGVGTVVRSLRTGMPIGETELLAENEPPSDITEDIKRGASGICSAVTGKATGMAQGLKEALTFDIGSGSGNSKDTQEGHHNSSSQQEESKANA